MEKSNLKVTLAVALAMAISFTGCRAIEGIFKAGVWVGVIAVLLVIALIFWLISKVGKK
jgi:hypothetical protein